MLEELRSRSIDEIESLCDVLESDIEQRQEWLIRDSSAFEKPEFMHKYTARTERTYNERDRRLDLKLDAAEDDSELTSEAKTAIQALRSEMQVQMRERLDVLDELFQKQFETNERFFNLTDEERSAVNESHNRERSSLMRRVRVEYVKKIDKVRTAPRSRSRTSYYEKSAWNRMRRERRDREELEFCISAMAMERELIGQFETYVDNLGEEREIPDKELERCRETHMAEVDRTMSNERETFDADRARRDRMSNARFIQSCYPERVQSEAYRELMDLYTTKMEATVMERYTTTTWERALLGIDQIFSANTSSPDPNWGRFVDSVVEYWISLGVLKRREKWDRMISRYAVLYLSESARMMKPVDVSYNTEMRALRDRRDRLLCRVLKMDYDIKVRYTKINTKPPRMERPKKEKPTIMKNYQQDERSEPVHADGSRSERKPDLGSKDEEPESKSSTGKRDRRKLISFSDDS